MMTEIYAKYDKVVDKRRTLEARLEKLEYQIRNLNTSWLHNIAEPLAKTLSKEFGMPHDIYGPFGLTAETTIYLYATKVHDICKGETYSITLEPHFDDNLRRIRMYYRTGKINEEYPEGSIGYYNNLGREILPLPESIAEIKALMQHNMPIE